MELTAVEQLRVNPINTNIYWSAGQCDLTLINTELTVCVCIFMMNREKSRWETKTQTSVLTVNSMKTYCCPTNFLNQIHFQTKTKSVKNCWAVAPPVGYHFCCSEGGGEGHENNVQSCISASDAFESKEDQGRKDRSVSWEWGGSDNTDMSKHNVTENNRSFTRNT